MDWNDPNLEAFESISCAIIWVREIGKIAALTCNICSNSSDRQQVRALINDNVPSKLDKPKIFQKKIVIELGNLILFNNIYHRVSKEI